MIHARARELAALVVIALMMAGAALVYILGPRGTMSSVRSAVSGVSDRRDPSEPDRACCGGDLETFHDGLDCDVSSPRTFSAAEISLFFSVNIAPIRFVPYYLQFKPAHRYDRTPANSGWPRR